MRVCRCDGDILNGSGVVVLAALRQLRAQACRVRWGRYMHSKQRIRCHLSLCARVVSSHMCCLCLVVSCCWYGRFGSVRSAPTGSVLSSPKVLLTGPRATTRRGDTHQHLSNNKTQRKRKGEETNAQTDRKEQERGDGVRARPISLIMTPHGSIGLQLRRSIETIIRHRAV